MATALLKNLFWSKGKMTTQDQKEHVCIIKKNSIVQSCPFLRTSPKLVMVGNCWNVKAGNNSAQY